ncbi:MAG: redoxin domain-containing protein [Pseudomonadota bacterium]
MKRAHFLVCAIAAAPLAATAALAGPVVGETAPDFSGVTSAGETISLDQFGGKTVVLEWTNDGCPFVQRHYKSGNMQATQEASKENGAVWISVISSAPGKQGHVTAEKANTIVANHNAMPDYVILDESGDIGRAYAAKTTPHMFVIDGDQTLRYDGAIDDKPRGGEGAQNFVTAAVEAVSTGAAVANETTKPYGCSVKYGS